MDAINESRLRVWAQQPAEFFEEAILDADGTIVPRPTPSASKEWTSPTTASGVTIRS